MNTFQDLEHALSTGVVLGTLRRAGIHSDLLINSVDDPTPYIRLKLEGNTDVVIVVMPQE